MTEKAADPLWRSNQQALCRGLLCALLLAVAIYIHLSSLDMISNSLLSNYLLIINHSMSKCQNGEFTPYDTDCRFANNNPKLPG